MSEAVLDQLKVCIGSLQTRAWCIYAIVDGRAGRQVHRPEAHRAWQTGRGTCFLYAYDPPRFLTCCRNGTASAINAPTRWTPCSNLSGPNPSHPTFTLSPPTPRPSGARTTLTTSETGSTTQKTIPRHSALPRSQAQARLTPSATVPLQYESRRGRAEGRTEVGGRRCGTS